MPLFYTVVMKKLNDELVLHRDTERIGVQQNAVHGPGLLVHAQLKIGQDRKAETRQKRSRGTTQKRHQSRYIYTI